MNKEITTSKPYELTPIRRLVNALISRAIRLGIGFPKTYLLMTNGRKTGKTHMTPVSLVEQGGERWLVAPYGEVNWVRNARVAGQVTLMRRGRIEVMRIQQIGAAESAPILKAYLRQQPTTRPFFNAAPDAPPEAFTAEASQHPVFRLVPTLV